MWLCDIYHTSFCSSPFKWAQIYHKDIHREIVKMHCTCRNSFLELCQTIYLFCHIFVLSSLAFWSSVILSYILLIFCSLLTLHFCSLIKHTSLLLLDIIYITHQNNGPKILQTPLQNLLTFWIPGQGWPNDKETEIPLKSNTKSYIFLLSLL